MYILLNLYKVIEYILKNWNAVFSKPNKYTQNCLFKKNKGNEIPTGGADLLQNETD